MPIWYRMKFRLRFAHVRQESAPALRLRLSHKTDRSAVIKYPTPTRRDAINDLARMISGRAVERSIKG